MKTKGLLTLVLLVLALALVVFCLIYEGRNRSRASLPAEQTDAVWVTDSFLPPNTGIG